VTPSTHHDPSTAPIGGSPLVPVRSRRSVEPAAIVLVIAIAVVATALWKPWGAGPASDALAEARVPAPPTTTATGGTAGSSAAVAVARDRAFRATGTFAPPFAGLDLTFMGVADTHRAWGVAAAYVPHERIASNIAHGLSTVTPVVDWVSETPPGIGTRPVLNHLDTSAVAIGVTWPDGEAPGSVRLIALDARLTIRLDYPLPQLAHLAVSGSRHGAALDPTADPPQSGTFFLPPSGVPTNLSGWQTRGWAPGSYAFEVTGADRRIRVLPFEIVP
jgi:hypothetical protein